MVEETKTKETAKKEAGGKKEEKRAPKSLVSRLKKEKPSEEKALQKQKKEAAKEKKPKQEPISDAKAVADAFDVIKFVLMTEKSIRIIEGQNKLVFIVNRPSEKKQIKQAVEQAFGSPVSGVTTLIDQAGRKKAFVKFKNAGAAGDIAIKLGII